MFSKYKQTKKNSTSYDERELFCLYSIRNKILQSFLSVKEEEEKKKKHIFKVFKK
jgi:hypothetical protein